MKQNKKTWQRQVHRLIGAAGAVFVTFSVGLPMAALAASQNYSVLDDKAQPGMLMSVMANQGVVEQATNKNAALLVGVYTLDDTSFDKQAGQISVETDGPTTALVSTLNGTIKVGDRITVSSLAGVGAKAEKNSWVVGTAQGVLDAKTKGAVASTITDSAGGKHQVQIARIPVAVHVVYYAGPNAPKSSSVIPDKVQELADAVAKKHVSVVGLVLSFLLLVFGLTLAGILVSGAVRNAFTAIARQPLSKASVTRLMLKSFVMSGIIVIVVFLGSFLLLRIL